jgi:two-component system sensor histidine kinase PfeS
MNNKLLWKMFAFIAVGTVLLFWSIDILKRQTETQMSFIAKKHQQKIVDYAAQAEQLFVSNQHDVLEKWLADVQAKENTWVAIVQSSINTLINTSLSQRFMDEHRLGRSVTWKIHLYFKVNPVMEVTFADQKTRFLMQLPQRMRPGNYYPFIQIILQIALPFCILSLLSWMLYRHVMQPLSALKKATQQFSEGDYNIQLKPSLGARQDELTTLADSFDLMASRTGKLIVDQRQLLENLSHELRTPLARLDMALECIKQGIDSKESLARLSSESIIMRELVEDTLLLVWFNNEGPQMSSEREGIKVERFDIADLLEVICNDARFEYPHHQLELQCCEQQLISQSSQRALGQALENIIRNALQHTPRQYLVAIRATQCHEGCEITVEDQGGGVPVHLLEDIFQPFFQVDKSRARKQAVIPIAAGVRRGGFGLGLALAKRQISATGGTVFAENIYVKATKKTLGLRVTIRLPI